MFGDISQKVPGLGNQNNTNNNTGILTPIHGGTGIANTGTLTVTGNTSVSGSNTGDQTITLTGDITGSGSGSFGTTLATVNTNTGTFGTAWLRPVITVNGKGLITAFTTSTIIADPVSYSNFGGF